MTGDPLVVEESAIDVARARYEPPALSVLGSVHELTGWDWDDPPCVRWRSYAKTIGPPDFVNWIPIANCS